VVSLVSSVLFYKFCYFWKYNPFIIYSLRFSPGRVSHSQEGASRSPPYETYLLTWIFILSAIHYHKIIFAKRHTFLFLHA
jgi:hypothetical protein